MVPMGKQAMANGIVGRNEDFVTPAVSHIPGRFPP